MKVVVVGAGIAGLAVARALASRGVRPVVVARDGGATAAGAGIVTTQFWDPVLRPYARRGARILEDSVPVERCGMALVSLSERTAARLEPLGGSGRLPAALRSVLREDFLRRVARVAWSPQPFWVRNEDVRRAFSRGLRVLRRRVLGVEADCVRTDRGALRADHVVLAGGAWTRSLVPEVALEVRRTQTAKAQVGLRAMLYVLDTGLYGRPDGRGAIVGDGDVRLRRAPRASGPSTEGFARRMRRMLLEMFRSVGPVRPWRSGPLGMTPTRRPIVARIRDVWVVTGFGGDGLVLAPAFGEEVARRIHAGGDGATR